MILVGHRAMTVATLVLLAAVLFTASETKAKASPVTISGKAYRFNHMDTPLPGAIIKVRELPALSATTDAKGDYVLEVPNDTNVTPYIVSGSIPPGTDPDSEHYNEVDLQTFHPRGEDIENANFQSPTDFEFNLLKAFLAVPEREDGRPEQCALVTTSSARNVRGVDYQTFWDRTPHGVTGATSFGTPAIPGPIYFNENVIPDPSKTSSSDDGGIIWPVLPTGNFRIITEHPTTRFASFLATCAPGRIINANPPWGAFELAPGEKPLAASNVAASIKGVTIETVRALGGKKPTSVKRTVSVRIVAGEKITFNAQILRSGRTVVSKKVQVKSTTDRFIDLNVSRKVAGGKARLKMEMTDASGVSFTTTKKLRLPKPKRH